MNISNLLQETISSLEQEDGDESGKEKSRDKGNTESLLHTGGAVQQPHHCHVCKKVQKLPAWLTFR